MAEYTLIGFAVLLSGVGVGMAALGVAVMLNELSSALYNLRQLKAG